MAEKKKINAKDTYNKLELEAVKKVNDYKLICESNIVATLWKNKDLYYDYDKIKLEDFSHNEWRVFFQIGRDIILTEKKNSLDDITVGLYLEKHKKLAEKYIEYGGIESIEKAGEYVKEDNIEGYIEELYKWNAVLELSKKNFPIADRLSEYVDMTQEDIYDEYECLLNHVFINSVSSGVHVQDISDGLDDLLLELDEGQLVGLPYKGLDILNSETNGLNLGEMYLILAPSGVGKSSFVRSTILPSILEKNEKMVLMINEEDVKKQQKELLVWVANNIYKDDIQKYVLNNGKFKPEIKDILIKCKKWIENHKEQIIVISLDTFTTDKAIKIIKKYSSLGIKYFALDTFKYDSCLDSNNVAWLDLQLNSVKLYDLIKPSAKNVCLVCTMQLTKQSTKQRCYTMDNISSAKNVVDVATGVFMMRWMLPDEFPGESKELKVFKFTGKNKKSKIPVKLDPNKRYQIMFLIKNRFGSSNEFCIVFEVDLSRNTYKEIGICVITPDF